MNGSVNLSVKINEVGRTHRTHANATTEKSGFFLSLIHCLGASVRVVIVVIFLWQAVHPSNVGIFGKESFQT